ncbi:MAG: hypothetical protein R3A45_04935 [Bdellovibrionota bacterium]
MNLITEIERYLKQSNISSKLEIVDVPEVIRNGVKELVFQHDPRILDEEQQVLYTSSLFGGGHISLWNLSIWLLQRSYEEGAERGVGDLISWLKSKEITVYYGMVILGPKVPTSIKITDDLHLYPSSQCPEHSLISNILIEDNYVRIHTYTGFIEQPCYVIFHLFKVPRIRESNVSILYRENMTQMEDIGRIISVLNRCMYHPFLAVSDTTSNTPSSGRSYVPVGPDSFFGNRMNSVNTGVQLASNSPDYSSLFLNLWKMWEKLDEKSQHKCRIAIDRWNNSLHRRNEEDACIELRIAFEALLLKGDEESISATLIQRVYKINKDLFLSKVVYDLYDAASSILHEGKLRSKIIKEKGKSQKSIYEILQISQKEFPKLVEYVMENGIPESRKKVSLKKIKNFLYNLYKKIFE